MSKTIPSRRDFMKLAGASGLLAAITACSKSSSNGAPVQPKEPTFNINDMRVDTIPTLPDADNILLTGDRHSATLLFTPNESYENARIRQVVYDKNGNVDSLTTSTVFPEIPAGKPFNKTPVWQFPYKLRDASDIGRLDFELIKENGEKHIIAGVNLTPQLAGVLSDDLHYVGEASELLEWQFKGYKNSSNTNPGLVVTRSDSPSNEESNAATNLRQAYVNQMNTLAPGAIVSVKKLSDLNGEKHRVHVGVSPNGHSDIATILSETNTQIPSGAGLIMAYERRPYSGILATGNTPVEAQLAARTLERVIFNKSLYGANKYKVTGTMDNPIIEAL